MEDVTLFWLFCTFFYVGLFTIGGGLVAITLMEQTIVDTGIVSPETFMNMIAISESTPGPLGINMATFVGYNLFGIKGGIIATIGEVLPSLICILIIARFLKTFHKAQSVQTVMKILRPSSTGIILVACVNVFISSVMNIPESFADFNFVTLFSWPSLAAYGVFLFLLFKFKIHPILLTILGAVFGILVF